MATSTSDGGGYDAASKAAVHAGLPGLLRLLDIDLPALLGGGGGRTVEPLPVDLPSTIHRADLLYRLPGGTLLHIEIQQQPDPTMGRRMVEYAIRLAAAYPGSLGRRAAVQVVVQVTGPAMRTRYEWAGVTGEFHLLHIPSLDPAVLLATPALSPFALVPGGVAAVAAVARHIAATDDPTLQWSLATLAVRLAPHLAGIIIEQLKENAMSTEIIVRELLKTDVGHSIFSEGRSEGRSEERHTAAVAVLRHRFPDADPARIGRTADRLSEAASGTVDAAFAVDELDA